MRWGEKQKRSVTEVRLPKTDTDEPWSEIELAQLRQMRAEDHSARLISLKLHRTLRSVNEKIEELRAPRR